MHPSRSALSPLGLVVRNHMRIYGAAIVVLLSACAGLATVSGVPPPAGHPILGRWKFDLPKLNCFEIYEFLPNGTRLYKSAEELGESAYDISPAPRSSGFYSIKDTITKNNGKPDCSGGTTPIGHEVTIFIRFHPSEPKLIMCQEESLRSCFGPFTRLENSDS